MRARRAISDDRRHEGVGPSRPAFTLPVLYHRGALLPAVFGEQARHHATGGRFHGTAVRVPHDIPAPAPLPSSHSPKSRKVDVNPYGKFSLDMEKHLDLGLSRVGANS